MLKKLLFVAVLASGVLYTRADTLETEFKHICTQTGVELQDMPIDMLGDSSDKVEKIVMAQLSPANMVEVETALSCLAQEKLWMRVDENGEGLNFYGEEKPDGKISIVLFINKKDESMLMYMDCDKEIVNDIHVN